MFSSFRPTLFVLLALSGVAIAQEPNTPSTAQTSTIAQPAASASPAAQSVSPAPGAVESKVGTPPAGMGQIVFFRPSRFAGGAIGFAVREGDTALGKLRSGNYFVTAVAPGTHVYTVHSEAKDVLTMEVEAGETYYVEGTITMGFMVGRPNLSPSEQATFDGMFTKLKRVK